MALRVMHRMPGRFRVQAVEFRQHAETLQHIQSEVGLLKGVDAVRTSPITGSIVIEYDPEHCSDDVILRQIAELSGLTAEIPALNEGPRESEAEFQGIPHLAAAIQEPVRSVDRGLFRLTGGYMDLRYGAPMVLALYGTLKLIREGPIPAIPWYLLYWWSFRMFVMLNRQPVERVL